MPTDNTAALQALLNAGPVILPSGNTYYVTGLTVPHNFNLNGCTIIYTPTTGNCLRVIAAGVTVQNGILTGQWDYTTANNTSGSSGIVSTFDRVTISTMTISQFSNYGINQTGNNVICTHNNLSKIGYIGYFYNAGSSNTTTGEFSYNTVDRSMVSSSWTTGVTQPAVAIRGSNNGAQVSTLWNIHDNVISMPADPVDWTAEGLEVRYLTYSNIYNNTFNYGSIGNSMVTGATYCTNYNNTYTGQNLEAIEIGASNNTSYGNTITSQVRVGILFDGNAANCTLDTTTISGCGGYCIQMVSGVNNVAITNSSLSIGANGKSGVYYQNATGGLSITNTNINGAGFTSTNGIFFDTSLGGFTMTKGSIINCTHLVTVYAASSGTTTDHLTFSCVNQPGGFIRSDINLNTSGTVGSNLTFNNSGCASVPIIAYSPSSKVAIINQAITSMVPVSTGGVPVSYGISPSLPSGLNFDTGTGIISGTPTVLSVAASYTITATNTSGSANTSITLSVIATAPVISYSPSSEVYTEGVSISTVTPISTGGIPVSYSIIPALPAGLSFNTSTGVITGTPTVLSPATTYLITASNTGGMATTRITITVNAPIPSISYSPSSVSTPISVAISPVSPVNTGGTPTGYSITPALPAGLVFNTTTGIISGTPTVLLSSTPFTISATNTGGTATTSFTLTVVTGVPNIAYSPSTNVYTISRAITPLSPINTGGIPVSYSVSPALPVGLSLNTTTGVISGTPSALTSVADYIVTATNTAGSATFDITITVQAAIPSITYTPASNTYLVSSPVTAWAPVNTGGIITSFSISPGLPTGLAFNTSTGVISGTPSITSSLTTYTITASNTGGTATTQISIAVDAPTSTHWRKKIIFTG